VRVNSTECGKRAIHAALGWRGFGTHLPVSMPNLVAPKAAVRCELPAEFRFLVASSGNEPPAGPDWLHEIKHDGHRLLAITDGGGGLTLRSRNGFNRTLSWTPIVRQPEPSSKV
jgi:ATP-dependent DNA ligase